MVSEVIDYQGLPPLSTKAKQSKAKQSSQIKPPSATPTTNKIKPNPPLPSIPRFNQTTQLTQRKTTMYEYHEKKKNKKKKKWKAKGVVKGVITPSVTNKKQK